MAGLSVPSSSLVGRARLLLSSSEGSQVPQLLLLTQEAEGLKHCASVSVPREGQAAASFEHAEEMNECRLSVLTPVQGSDSQLSTDSSKSLRSLGALQPDRTGMPRHTAIRRLDQICR